MVGIVTGTRHKTEIGGRAGEEKDVGEKGKVWRT